MNPKKVIFSDNTLWGLLNFRGTVIRHFIKKGYEVVIMAPEDEVSEMKAIAPSDLKFISVKMERTTSNPFKDLSYLFRVIKIYHKEKPDYVFHYTIKPNIYGSIAAKINGIKSSVMIAGLGYVFENKNLVSYIARMLYKIGLSCSNNVFLLNEENKEKVITRKLCSPEKITLLSGGEGVDLNLFKKYENDSEIVTFLFIGRILYDKGYREFVKCAELAKKEFSNVEFEVWGTLDVTYPNAVSDEQLKKDCQKEVIKYKGFIVDMNEALKRKGLVVMLPSYYGEGLNRSLMEACATGKPIITTNIAGCRETVIDGENGFIVSPKNVDELLNAVRRYMNMSTGERSEMSKRSRQLAEERFSVNDVEKIYDKLI